MCIIYDPRYYTPIYVSYHLQRNRGAGGAPAEINKGLFAAQPAAGHIGFETGGAIPYPSVLNPSFDWLRLAPKLG